MGSTLTSTFPGLTSTIVRSPGGTVHLPKEVLDLRQPNQSAEMTYSSANQTLFIPAISTSLPRLDHLLSQESFFPAYCSADITGIHNEAIDLSTRNGPGNQMIPSQSLYGTNPISDGLCLDQNVTTASYINPDELNCKPDIPIRQPRVIGTRKPRLVSRSGVNRQPRRKSTRLLPSCSYPARRMSLRNRQPRRRYIFESSDPISTADEDVVELESDQAANSNTKNSTLYGQPSERVTIQQMEELAPLRLHSISLGAEYRPIVSNNYSPYAEHSMHRRQTCSTCRIQFEDSLSFVKHIQRVHLGITLTEMKKASMIQPQTQWNTLNTTAAARSISQLPSGEQTQSHGERIKTER
ncbi:unnamed protein product [Echinostoma caproni]|uniref:C2H2-type domain-containing protein n=1 Tax=Echinostoma caproni TaxID=27848 RepID=A0A183AWS7_9TREM|nr:unnamed protein product [Echinostoma caproni]